MKNIKSFILYGIIILLSIAAFGGYVLKQKTAKETGGTVSQQTVSQPAAQNPDSSKAAAADSAADTGSTSAAEPEAIEVNATLLTVADGIAGKSEEEKRKHIQQVMKRETEKLDPNPVVGVGRGEDFGKVTLDAVNNAGGLKDIIKKGDVVLIKPNICIQDEKSGSPMITDYRVVREVVNIAKECGASRIIIAEGNFASNAFENQENRYVTINDAELYNFNDCDEKDCYELTPQKSLVGKTLFVPKIYMDADVVIDVAKLKTHYITGVSLGLKNSIGIPPYKIYGISASKTGLHNLGIEEVILDLNKIRKPDFTIIDGIIGGENFGPYANTPVNSNVIFAGKDIVAVDTVALTFMGFQVELVSHVMRAAEEKLGIADLSKIKVEGADLQSIRMEFKPAY